MSQDNTKRNYSTFNPYVEYEGDSDVKSISVDDLEHNYESEYVTMFNHISSAGWVRLEGGFWLSPHNFEIKYKHIKKAYNSQLLHEKVNARKYK